MELFGFNLEEIIWWHWWGFAGIFLILEVLSKSFFFLWLGFSAVCVGLIMLIVPDLSWQTQFLIWACISVTTTGCTPTL